MKTALINKTQQSSSKDNQAKENEQIVSSRTIEIRWSSDSVMDIAHFWQKSIERFGVHRQSEIADSLQSADQQSGETGAGVDCGDFSRGRNQFLPKTLGYRIFLK